MKKVYFDSEKCLGCHSCEFACAVEHSVSKDPRKAHLEDETPAARRKVQLVEGMCLTVACRHCDPAPCVEACVIAAMTKDRQTGEVRCDTERCIGCWMCVMVCPFDAVRPGKVFTIKCDMCQDEESPVCVDACPTKALFEATTDEFRKICEAKQREEKACQTK